MPNSKQIKLCRLPIQTYLLSCARILALGCSALATTVIPPSFDELVSRAEVIFQGTVTDVRSQWVGEGGQRHINSYVTFKVEDAIKGKPGAQITLQMLGGTVGSETMEVTDAPKFKVGDRDILIEVLRRWSPINQGTSFDARSRFTFCLTSFVRSIAAFAQSCSLAGRGVNVA